MSSYRMKYKIGATQYHIPVVDDMAGFGSGIPLGTILPYSANTLNPPEGFLFCDGSAISRSMYPDLFALIGTTYGSGDGSTTFNLPDLTGGKFLEGTTAAGTSKDAGLPNITGSTATNYNCAAVWPESVQTGSFVKSETITHNYVTAGTASNGYDLCFDASKSNPIYGNSITVQPSSVTVRYIIKAFSATTSESQLIDVTQYASALNGKSSKSLNDLSQAGEDHFYENDFTIIYPNGTASNPGAIGLSSRYIADNPFPGYIVNCIAEVQFNGSGVWISYEWADNVGTGSYSTGFDAWQNPNDLSKIVVNVGNNWPGDPNDNKVYNSSAASGSEMLKSVPSSAVIRVKVWKIGKIPT